MGDPLHLLSTRQPLPAQLLHLQPPSRPVASPTNRAAAAAHYAAEAELALLLASLRDELGMADQLLRLALNLLSPAAKFELARQADTADLIGPSGGTIRAHERAAVLQRAGGTTHTVKPTNTNGRG